MVWGSRSARAAEILNNVRRCITIVRSQGGGEFGEVSESRLVPLAKEKAIGSLAPPECWSGDVILLPNKNNPQSSAGRYIGYQISQDCPS